VPVFGFEHLRTKNKSAAGFPTRWEAAADFFRAAQHVLQAVSDSLQAR